MTRCTRPALSIMAGFIVCATAIAQNPRPAEQAFKNIKVLTGVPEDQIQPTMWFFCASLGVRCRYCHEEDNTKRELDTKPQKAMARRMIEMTMALNKNSFNSRAAVTCNTCHRGSPRPVGAPPVGEVSRSEYSSSEEVNRPASTKAVPSLDQILAAYDAALGGAPALEKIRGREMKGTVSDIKGKATPVEVLAKGSDNFLLVSRGREENGSAIHGDSGWLTAESGPRDMRPNELEGARLENPVYVLGRVRQAFSDLRMQGRAEKIADRDVFVVAGRSMGATPVRLFFDSDSGLLVRLAYNTQTAFGPYFTQVDYSDYRDVEGSKFPFRWKVSRVRSDVSDYKIDELKVNVSIDDAKFTKPAPGK